jgi:hypothetical protein
MQPAGYVLVTRGGLMYFVTVPSIRSGHMTLQVSPWDTRYSDGGGVISKLFRFPKWNVMTRSTIVRTTSGPLKYDTTSSLLLIMTKKKLQAWRSIGRGNVPKVYTLPMEMMTTSILIFGRNLISYDSRCYSK